MKEARRKILRGASDFFKLATMFLSAIFSLHYSIMLFSSPPFKPPNRLAKIFAVFLVVFVFFVVDTVYERRTTGTVNHEWLVWCVLGVVLYFVLDLFSVAKREVSIARMVTCLVASYSVFVALGWGVWYYAIGRGYSQGVSIWIFVAAFFVLLGQHVLGYITSCRRLRKAPSIVVGVPEIEDKFLHDIKESGFTFVAQPFFINGQADDALAQLEVALLKGHYHQVIVLRRQLPVGVCGDVVILTAKFGCDTYINTTLGIEGEAEMRSGSMGDVNVEIMSYTPSPTSFAWQMKMVLDRVGACLIILITSPLWVFAFFAIKLSDPGPVFFRQQRSGLFGRPFGMWKFRSMCIDAEDKLDEVKETIGNDMDGPIFKLENDPRIFKMGHVLRKYSIDELPQLLNVVTGDMSLVGPRPLPVYETEAFTELEHHRRMSVKPGMTGYWQIAGRSNVTDFDQLVQYDLKYIDNWSLWLDLTMLLRTIPAVLFAKGAK